MAAQATDAVKSVPSLCGLMVFFYCIYVDVFLQLFWYAFGASGTLMKLY